MKSLVYRIRQAGKKDFAYLAGRLLDRVIAQILATLSGTRWNGLSAALLHVMTRRITASSRVKPLGKPHDILVLSKAMFNEDIRVAFEGSPGFRVYGIHRDAVKALARSFIPGHMDENNYVSLSPTDESAKTAYREYCVRVLRSLLKHRNYRAVLTANYAYYAERELAAACESMGVAFMALHKENIRSPGFADFMERIYRERRGPFTGRRVLVYNALEKDIQVRAGVASPDRITVTGMPRMDRCHRHRLEVAASGKPEIPEARVVFFSFGPKTLLPGIMRKLSVPPHTRSRERLEPELEQLSWTRLLERLNRAMLNLALKHPEITVVIKTKGSFADKEIASVKQTLKVDRLPRNLQVLLGGDPIGEIARSAAVCGFNTTALLEAVAMGVPAVVPRFEECLDEATKRYVVDFEDAVEYADSEEDVIARLAELARTRAAHSSTLTATHERILNKWLFNADGNAGARVRDAVLLEIENKP